MQHTLHIALVKESHALAVGRVLILEGIGSVATGAAIHPDVPLVPGERMEHQPLLHWFRDPREALLDPLEGHGLGDQPGSDVEEGGRGGSQPLPPLPPAPPLPVRAVPLAPPAHTFPRPRHLHSYREIFNQYMEAASP